MISAAAVPYFSLLLSLAPLALSAVLSVFVGPGNVQPFSPFIEEQPLSSGC